MKTKFIQENVILSTHEGPFGVDPQNDWTGMTVMEVYRKEYPKARIISDTDEKRILKVGDWHIRYYIMGKAKKNEN
jgi:hypothetical protein